MSRRPFDPRKAAEAVFKPAAPKLPESAPAASAPRSPALPGAKEAVTLRIDRDLLEHFQAGGAGWQERINDALRKFAGK